MKSELVFWSLVILCPPFLVFTSTGEFLHPEVSQEYIKPHPPSNSCEAVVNRFGDKAKDFTVSIIENSAPVTYCRESVKSYLLFEEAYRNVTTLVDHKNITCRNIYFNVDRLGVVETMYNQLHQMWMIGFCDDCYANTSQAIFSNTTLDFDHYWEQITSCIANSKPEDPCLKCMSHYQRLNDFYDGIKKEKEDRICFDLQDAMNRTRILWSGELNCCRDRKSSMVVFYVVSSIVASLPVIFYVAFYFHTRYQERFDMISLDDEPSASHTNHSAASSTSVESQNHRENQPGPSSRSIETLEANPSDVEIKKPRNRRDSDESDDENLLR